MYNYQQLVHKVEVEGLEMAGLPVEDFNLQRQRLVRGFAGDFAGGGSGGGPGATQPGSTSVRRNVVLQSQVVHQGRVVKSERGVEKGMSALEKAKLEAEQVREMFKKTAKQQVETGLDTDVFGDEVRMEIKNAAKYEKRLQMNRRSAAASRVRKDAYIKILEKHLQAMEDRSNVMARELLAAKNENEQLKTLVIPQQEAPVTQDIPVPGLADIDFFLDCDL